MDFFSEFSEVRSDCQNLLTFRIKFICMIKIIADRNIPFLKGVLEPFCEVKYMAGNEIGRKELTGTDALLIRTRTKCTQAILKDTGLKFIGTATIGFDHIDTRYCTRAGIKWINAPGCNSSSVHQYISAALLKISHEFKFNLKGKTIGIVGVGNVGSKIEKLARAIGMQVLLNDPPRAEREGDSHFVALDTLLMESDFVTMHVPLSLVGQFRTYHMINDRAVRKMKKGAWFINSSRGEVALTSALRKGKSSGWLTGIVADVWEDEPYIDNELMNLAYLATPHIAGYSTDGKANGTAMVVRELSEFFDLPLKDWYPEKLPDPEDSVITIDGKGKSELDIIREAVEQTYNISEDDTKLRFSPADFEKLRSDYPVRREFSAYTVNLKNSDKKTKTILSEIGFGILA